jgi:hypothetical protein
VVPATVVVVSLASVVPPAVLARIAQPYRGSTADFEPYDPLCGYSPDGDLSFVSWAAACKRSLPDRPRLPEGLDALTLPLSRSYAALAPLAQR